MFTLTMQPVESTDWRVRIAAERNGQPARIFVYHSAANPIPSMDHFSCVASVPQLAELPENSPLSGVPFYRTSELHAVARNAQHARVIWDKVHQAVKDLADNLALLDRLTVVETVNIRPRRPGVVLSLPTVGRLTYSVSLVTYDGQQLTCSNT